jgi:hypothetical protein
MVKAVMAIDVAVAPKALLEFGLSPVVLVAHVCVIQSHNGMPATQCMHVTGLSTARMKLLFFPHRSQGHSER